MNEKQFIDQSDDSKLSKTQNFGLTCSQNFGLTCSQNILLTFNVYREICEQNKKRFTPCSSIYCASYEFPFFNMQPPSLLLFMRRNLTLFTQTSGLMRGSLGGGNINPPSIFLL